MSNAGWAGQRIHTRYIALFWLPLAAMWLFMGMETPIINAFIARLALPKDNLAAFGVVFSVGVLVESPIIQMLTTGTALAWDKAHFRRLMRFMTTIGSVLTVIHMTIALTPLFDFILGPVMGIPRHVIDLSRGPFLVFFPFHAAVGYRRLWQGVLIKYGKTKEVTYTMVVRFICTTGIMTSGFFITDLDGAMLGALALTGGVISGAAASWIFVRRVVRGMEERKESTSLIGWRELIRFYSPLALTSLIIVGIRPVLAAGIARGNMPLESLAAWPVIHGFIFLFRSVALSYQEVVVALLGDPKKRRALRRFTLYLAGGIAVCYLITAFTALSDLWFAYIAGLEDDLLPFTGVPFILGAPVPILSALVSYYRGRLVHARRTKTIAMAVFINSALVILVVFLGVSILSVSGASIAAGALSFSLVVETVFLYRRVKKMDLHPF